MRSTPGISRADCCAAGPQLSPLQYRSYSQENRFIREVTRRGAKNCRGVADSLCMAIQHLADRPRLVLTSSYWNIRHGVLVDLQLVGQVVEVFGYDVDRRIRGQVCCLVWSMFFGPVDEGCSEANGL